MRKNSGRALLTAGTALLAVLPYLNGLRNGFSFDDVAIVAENPRIRSLSGLGQAFSSDWWGGKRPRSLLYRPLAMATFSIDYAALRSGEAAPPPARLPDRAALPFHLQNLLWHAAASAALFVLVLEIFSSSALALASAALFAVHPVHSEAVDGIVGRAELMSAFFVFTALVVARRTLQGSARPLLAALLLFLALCSKESAIVIPALPLLWPRPLEKRERRSWLRDPRVRRLLIALAGAALAYLALRTLVLGSVLAGRAGSPARLDVDNPIASATGAARVLTPLRVFGHVLRLLLYPRALSADYSLAQIPLVTSPDVASASCALALCGLLAAAYLLRRRAPAASFGICFFFLTWALTSNFFVPIGTILGERLLYLPSAGACLVIASALLAAGRRLGAPRLAAALLAALTMLGAARTWARNPDWKDSLTLFESATRTSPRSCKAAQGLAAELVNAGRPADGRRWAERSLQILPDYLEAHDTLSKACRLLAAAERDPARARALRTEARQHARFVIEHSSGAADDAAALADAWNVLAALALDEGDLDAAADAYRRSVELDPGYVPALIGSGAVQAMRAGIESDPRRKDELEEAAVARFEQALRLDPGNAQAQQNAALTLYSLAARAPQSSRREQLVRRAALLEQSAFATYRRAGDLSSLANLEGVSGSRLLGERRFAEAQEAFREAIRLQPDAARGYLGLGSVLSAEAENETDPERRRALVGEILHAFERARELDPADPTARLDLALTYLRLARDPAKVIEHLRAYLALAPDSPQRAPMEQTIREMEALLARGEK